MKVIVDTELSGFEDNATMWCIVARDLDTDEIHIFEHPEQNPQEFTAFSKLVDQWIGHNFLQFDRPALLKRFPEAKIELDSVVDTLVVSHLLNHNIEGGHSLEAWAGRLEADLKKGLDKPEKICYNSETAAEGGNLRNTLGIPKELPKESIISSYYLSTLKELPKEVLKVQITDFSIYTRELLVRCISDTRINRCLALYFDKYLKHPAFEKALKIEHRAADICRVLHDTGFAIDRAGAAALHEKLSLRLQSLDQELLTAFPPKRTLVNTITARGTKDGGIHSVDFRRLVLSGYHESEIVAGREYPIYSDVPFNPGSHKQIIERLNDAGWKPTEKTKGHIAATDKRFVSRDKHREPLDKEKLEYFKVYGWTLSEDNLATLPDTAPQAAQSLVERLLLASRVSTLEQWLELAVQGSDGVWRIHGQFLPIGAWTHRMAHQKPNMANVPKAKPKDKPSAIDLLSDSINDKMRELWIAPPGRRLIGVDADGIQMRIFAHYVNDQRLIDSLLKGKKDDKTDIHSLHQRALGDACKSRDAAKRFIYAWLLGAGVGKVAEILECSLAEAKEAVNRFIEFYPGLRELKQSIIPSDAARGYFIGLDGRYVVCDDPHLMLAGYLQNGEALVMKYAMVEWYDNLFKQNLDDLAFVNFVHDEWQTEAPDINEVAERVAKAQMDAIVNAGIKLGVRCPLAGTSVMGYNWKETH